MPMSREMGIGEVASRLNLSADTLRYYEKIGLLKAIPRQGGQRRYRQEHLNRLRFIRRAQSIDFSLEEIGQLLDLSEDPISSRSEVREMAQEKLNTIETRLITLQQLHQELTQMVECCQHGAPGPCPIIQQLEQNEPEK